MKKKVLIFGIVFGCLSLGIALSIAAVGTTDNLVSNPGFENGFSEWGKWAGRRTKPIFSIDTAVSYQGEKSLKITGTSMKDWAIVYNHNLKLPEGSYKFTVWYKTKDLHFLPGKGAHVQLKFIDENNKHVKDLMFPLEKSEEWKKFSGEFTRPEGAPGCWFHLGLDRATGNVWFDDVSLVYTGAQEKYTEAEPGVESAEEVKSEIKVNLIKNPGFEEDADSDGIPDNWDIRNWRGTPDLVFKLDDEVYKSGSLSMCIECPTAARGALMQNIKVEAGKTYNFSIWCKSEKLTGYYGGLATVFFQFIPEGRVIFNLPMQGTKGWTKSTTAVTMPAGTTGVTIQAQIFNSSGKVWFDDVQMAPVEE